jgi:hypothetical protein
MSTVSAWGAPLRLGAMALKVDVEPTGTVRGGPVADDADSSGRYTIHRRVLGPLV